VTPRIFRSHLFSVWWSLTRSVLALTFDGRIDIGRAEELVYTLRDLNRPLQHLRDDIGENRLGWELVGENREP
jgi:hypothetical protein